jgi:hypothetical protein
MEAKDEPHTVGRLESGDSVRVDNDVIRCRHPASSMPIPRVPCFPAHSGNLFLFMAAMGRSLFKPHIDSSLVFTFFDRTARADPSSNVP